jgi:hypothetical protein
MLALSNGVNNGPLFFGNSWTNMARWNHENLSNGLTLSLIGQISYFWDNIKFTQEEGIRIVNFPNSGGKDDRINRVATVEFDFPINYN